VILVLLQLERDGFLVVVTVVVFMEVALVGKMIWIVLTPLLSKWLGTGFILFVLTPVLSRLFAHVLVFEFQVGDLKNIWLIDSGCSRHMTRDKGWFSSLVPVLTKRYITFVDNGRGRVLSEGEIKVSDCCMDLPGPTTSVGTRTDYSVGPWDYSACATRHLKAWSTRTTQE
jgi:hypothetical protein